MGDGEITGLPEGCISDILSLTSPRDCCRSAAVSATFRSAADSDTVWDRFLPSDLSDLLSRAVATVHFASKKDLYFRLCDGILIDGSRMIFSLERLTGRRCYTLSARELNIVWGDTPRYWTWGPHQDSRFPEVAELKSVCWLEIRGKIDCRILSQRTNYAAYLIFKLAEGSYNLTNQKASVRVGGYVSESKVCLQTNDDDNDDDSDDDDDDDDDEDVDEEEEDEEEDEEQERDNEDDTMEEEEEEETVVVGSHVTESEVCSQPDDEAASQGGEEEEDDDDDDDDDDDEVEETRVVGRAPRRRHDGWMEMELGEFFNVDGDDGEVEMSLMGKEGISWKRGLIVEGIEVRPK